MTTVPGRAPVPYPAAPAAGRPRQGAVRDRILRAARDTFRRSGVRSARMDDIAGAAGIARPNIYRYFPNREALVGEVLISEVRSANEERRRVVPVQGPARELLVESLVIGAERVQADVDLMSVLVSGDLDVTARVVGADRRILDVELEYWAPVLAHCRARGEVAPHLSDERIVRWFMSAHFSFASRPELFDGDRRAWIADFIVPPVLAAQVPQT